MEFVTILYLCFMFIALYFFSFFIILTLRNKEKLFSYPAPDNSHFISVLIPAYNEESSIKETVEHVCNSDYPKDKLEVIVISDGSTDGTVNIVKNLMKKYSFLKILNKKNSGKADSLNQGIKMARGDLFAVVDADSFPEKESLRKLTGYFRDKDMAAVTSFVGVRNGDTNLLTKVQALEYLIMGWNKKLFDCVDALYVTNGPLSLYRKEYVVKIGGFDPKSITEDIDVTWNCLNHNYKTALCLDAKVSTVAPTKFKKWFRQRLRWGIGGLQAISKYRSTFLGRGIIGFFILPYVSFSIVLSMATFLFSLYLLFKAIFVKILTTTYIFETGGSVFGFRDINLYPSVIIFYFITMFTLSLSYSYYILGRTNHEKNLSIRKFFNLLFYVLVYLTMYPSIWFVAIYKFIVVKKHKW